MVAYARMRAISVIGGPILRFVCGVRGTMRAQMTRKEKQM